MGVCRFGFHPYFDRQEPQDSRLLPEVQLLLRCNDDSNDFAYPVFHAASEKCPKLSVSDVQVMKLNEVTVSSIF